MAETQCGQVVQDRGRRFGAETALQNAVCLRGPCAEMASRLCLYWSRVSHQESFLVRVVFLSGFTLLINSLFLIVRISVLINEATHIGLYVLPEHSGLCRTHIKKCGLTE